MGKIIKNIKMYLIKIFSVIKLDEHERWILKQFTALPPIDIEYDFLYSLLQVQKLDWKDNFSTKLKRLYCTGFLHKNKKNESYRLRTVLYDVWRTSQFTTINEIRSLIDTVINLLGRYDPKDNPIEKISFIPYGVAIIELFPNKIDSDLALLRNKLAMVYKDLGKYEKACDLLEEALKITKENFGEKHPNVAYCQSNLAMVYSDLGEYEKSRDLFEESLKSDLEYYGDKGLRSVIRQSRLADVYQKLVEHEKERDLLEKVYNSVRENFGKKEANVAVCQSKLAKVYSDLGEYEKARDLMEKALKITKENSGEKHPNVACYQNNLAFVYQKLGKYEKARDLLEEALKTAKENFGEKHPTVATRQFILV
ncbi:MAG: tetratricopeptide repeat protein [Candidatus Magasanikbacteria bacterium]